MLLYAQLLILSVLAFLDIWLGIFWGAYVYIWWWDLVTHVLGGVWAGLCFIWIQRNRGKKSTILDAALAALVVGFVWEIFEYMFDLGSSPYLPYWAESLKDLLVDTIGGATAAGIVALTKNLWQRK